MEQFYNYQDMSFEQRKTALNNLSSVGFFPAYGKIKTMKNVMDKSVGLKMPQFYFVFRDKELIGYMFFIGDSKKFRAFPWLAIDNLDELPMRIVEPLMDIAIRTWSNEDIEKSWIVESYKQRLENYRNGIGRRSENECR